MGALLAGTLDAGRYASTGNYLAGKTAAGWCLTFELLRAGTDSSRPARLKAARITLQHPNRSFDAEKLLVRHFANLSKLSSPRRISQHPLGLRHDRLGRCCAGQRDLASLLPHWLRQPAPARHDRDAQRERRHHAAAAAAHAINVRLHHNIARRQDALTPRSVAGRRWRGDVQTDRGAFATTAQQSLLRLGQSAHPPATDASAPPAGFLPAAPRFPPVRAEVADELGPRSQQSRSDREQLSLRRPRPARWRRSAATPRAFRAA